MFLALSVAVTMGAIPGDRAALRVVTDVVGTRDDETLRIAAWVGTAWVLVPLALVLAAASLVRRAWGALGAVFGTAVLVWLVNPGLKRLFARERPDIRELPEATSRWSYPSGHAVGSAAFAVLVVLLAWPTRGRGPVLAGAIVAVGVVGASQLGLGVHRPTDLVAGWALGIAVVAALGAWTLVPTLGSRSDCDS